MPVQHHVYSKGDTSSGRVGIGIHGNGTIAEHSGKVAKSIISDQHSKVLLPLKSSYAYSQKRFQ